MVFRLDGEGNLGTVIAENAYVHALMGQGRPAVVFEDVDISVAVEVPDTLRLTVLFDHDTLDGLPAARCVAKVAGRLEKGAVHSGTTAC